MTNCPSVKVFRAVMVSVLLGFGRHGVASEWKGSVELINPTPYEIQGQVFRCSLKEAFPAISENGTWAVKALDATSRKAIDAVVTGADKGSASEILLLADASPFSRRQISLALSPRTVRADGGVPPAVGWPVTLGGAAGIRCQVAENGSLTGIAFGGTPAWGLENRILLPEKIALRSAERQAAGALEVLDLQFAFSEEVALQRKIVVTPGELLISEALVNNSDEVAESAYRQRVHETILSPKLRDVDFSAAYFGGITDLTKGEHFGDLVKGRKPDSIFPESMCAFGFRRGKVGIAVVQENNRPDWIQGFFCGRGAGEIVSILGPYRMQAHERREREISMVRFGDGLKGFEKAVRSHRDYKSWGRPRLVASRTEIAPNLALSIIDELPKLGLSQDDSQQVKAVQREVMAPQGLSTKLPSGSWWQRWKDTFAGFVSRSQNQARPENETMENLRRLDGVDIPAIVRQVAGADPKKEGLAPLEGKWAAIIQRQRRVLLNAAIWDYNMGRFSRSLERLREAVRLGDTATKMPALTPSPALKDLKEDVIGWQPYVSIVRELGHNASPFDLARQIHDSGFDVLQASLTWGAGPLPPDYGQVTKDEQNFFDFDEFFAEAKKYRFKVNARLNPWPPMYLKERYPGGKMVSGDNTLNISPSMLGQDPEYRKLYMEQHIRPLVRRYGARGIQAWDYAGEPQLYGGRGITDDLMKTAFSNWLRKKYQGKTDNITAAWGTKVSSFDELKPPAKIGAPGWYDVVLFKCECLAESLRLGSQEIQKLSPTGIPVGQSYCSNVMGPANVNNGWGYDPWISASGQLGDATLSDIYFGRTFLKDLLRIYELYCGGGMRPVESQETNNYIKDLTKVRGAFRMEDPDQWRCTAISCMMFGLKGIAFWSWSGVDGNWDVLDADETLSHQAIAASRVAQEFREWSPLIKSLRPVSNVGLYYPRAGFINGTPVEAEVYEGVFYAMITNGFQPTLFSDSDAEGALKKFKTVIVPQSRSVERSFLAKLEQYVREGGQVIYLGDLPATNEYKLPLGADKVEALFGVKSNSAKEFFPEDVLLNKSSLRLTTRFSFKQYEPLGAQPFITTSKGETLCYVHPLGKGQVAFLPSPVCSGFLEGAEVANLAGTWKFNFGAQWPVRPPSAESEQLADAAPDRGVAEKWERPEYNDAKWADIKVPGTWDGQGYDCGGWAWYRHRVVLPPTLEGKKIHFYGDSLHNKAWIYVNGELVKTTKSFNETFAVDITQHLKPGKENTLAMRIRGPDFGGGVRGNVKLVSPDLQRADWKLFSMVLRHYGVLPQTGEAPSSFVRMLMRDGKGNPYLGVANYSTEPFHGKILLSKAEIGNAKGGQNLFEPSHVSLNPSSTEGFVELPLDLKPYDAGLFTLY